MKKKNCNDLPRRYPVCMLADCPMASSCLRRTSCIALQARETYLTVINPAMCTRGEGCPFYRSAAPARYARGFTNFQKKMFPGQYRNFMYELISKFGRNEYFAYRRGEWSLSPAKQEIVRAALRKAGIREDFPFDHYEEQLDYFD